MAAHEFGERVDDDVGAVIDGAGEVGRGEGVVDHERNAVLVGDFGDGFDIENVAARVADGFAVEQLGFGRDGFAEIFRIVGLDEREVVAEPAHGRIELREGAAVEGAGGNDVVAGAAMVVRVRNCAAWPLDRPSAATPFSSEATRSSRTAVVGFMMRV